MTFQRSATWTVVALLLCGVAGVGFHYHARREARLGQADTVWRITYAVEGEATRDGAELRAASPADTRHCRVFRQDFRQSNLRIDPGSHSSPQARDVVALAEEPGPCESTLRFDLRLNPRADWPIDDRPVLLTVAQRDRYLATTGKIQSTSPAVTSMLAELRQPGLTPAALVQRIFDFCYGELEVGDADAPSDAAEALAQRLASPVGCDRAMIALCRAAAIPARSVVGFEIAANRDGAPRAWVEVLLEGRWVPYDPVRGHAQSLPYNYVPARRGDDRVVIGRSVDNLRTEFSIVQLPTAALGMGSAQPRATDILDLARLPLDVQRVLSVILLMPLGALVTCVFRNLVGLKTSGSFTPTLLALSFVFADWRTGAVVLAAAVVLGLATRWPIDRLKLLIMPRLSIMLTVVVFSIVFGISALQYYRVAPGSHAVLLPMVILTMLVERFYLTTQEDGPRVAVEHLAGTLVVGFCCYLLLRWETVARFVLLYPEVHFFTVAALVMIGRYTGYQLFEPLRFRDFADVGQR